MRSFLFKAQFTTMCYRCAKWTAGLKLNISANARACVSLIEFQFFLGTNDDLKFKGLEL
jgi:hypothetical protein